MRLILSSLGFGFLVLSSWNTGEVSWQCSAFQAVRQRPLRRCRGCSNLSQLQQQQPQRQNNHITQRYYYRLHNSVSSKDNNQDADEEEDYSTKKLPLQSLTSSYQTALCVVPPDESWDTLQRARHFADDKTYHQWPPAIRLFHPFCPASKLSNLALDVATIIEKHKIEPFTITLNRWTVMPLPDTLQIMLEEQDSQNQRAGEDGEDGLYRQHPAYSEHPKFQEIDALIAREEIKGRERKKQRDLRQQQRLKLKEMEENARQSSSANKTQFAEASSSGTNVLDIAEEGETVEAENETIEPRATYDEFNGPSMIAVEPDEESSRKLKQLRELIRRELLDAFDPNSPSASLWDDSMPLYDTEHDEEAFEEYVDDITAFRPLIPIGAFSTIDAALSTARKLKGFWDPLSFDVTDLHFISQAPASRQRVAESTESYYSMNFDPAASSSNVGLPVTHFRQEGKTQQIRDPGSAFGCDAIVMLMGEEIEMDDESNELLANLVWEEGTPGGFGREGSDGVDLVVEQEVLQVEEESNDNDGDDANSYNAFHENYTRKLYAKGGEIEELVDWLDGDDEEDDMNIGTTVVIGRTHMFSGEKRPYAGMPASSITEEADGTFSLGDAVEGDF